MSVLRKGSSNDSDKALILHSSSTALRSNQLVQYAPPQATTPLPGIEFDLLDSLQRHWLMSVLIFVLIAAIGTARIVRSIRPVYQAETTIYVPQDADRNSTGDSLESSYRTIVNQLIMTILKYDTLSEVLQQLSKKGIAFKNVAEPERQAVDRLRGSLDVQQVPDSYEISIQMTSPEPDAAAAIANTVAETFLAAQSRRNTSGRNDRGATFLAEKTILEGELQKKLDLRTKLAQTLQVVNLHKSTTLPDDEVIIQMRQQLALAHSKRIEAEERLAQGQSTVSIDAEQLADGDPTARTITSNLLQRQFELRERVKSMLPSHPVRKEADRELASIDAQLQKGAGDKVPKLTSQLLAKLGSQAAEARQVELELTREIAREESNIPNVSRTLGEAELVNSDITRIQDHLSQIDGQIEDITLRGNIASPLRVFSVAQPPASPMKSQRAKALAMLAAVGIFLALAIPVGIDFSDSRIHDPETIERLLGFPIVGMTIERNPKSNKFADEHLRRLVAGIERGIAEGARTVLFAGLKQPVPASLIRDVSRQLSGHKISVTIRAGRRKVEPDFRGVNSDSRLIGNSGTLTSELENCDVLLMDAPALVFSSDAERMAVDADMTLVVVLAGKNTKKDLVRGARLLERLNVPAVGIVLEGVRVQRSGRSLRRDLKEYRLLQRQMAGIRRDWEGKTFV